MKGVFFCLILYWSLFSWCQASTIYTLFHALLDSHKEEVNITGTAVVVTTKVRTEQKLWNLVDVTRDFLWLLNGCSTTQISFGRKKGQDKKYFRIYFLLNIHCLVVKNNIVIKITASLMEIKPSNVYPHQEAKQLKWLSNYLHSDGSYLNSLPYHTT